MSGVTRAEGWSGGFRDRFGDIVDRIGGTKAAAGIAGCSHDQISNYREGRSKIPLAIAHRLCHAAGVSLDHLVDGHAGSAPAREQMRSSGHRHLSDRAIQLAATVVVEASRSFPTLPASDIADAIVSRAHEEQVRLDELTVPANSARMHNL